MRQRKNAIFSLSILHFFHQEVPPTNIFKSIKQSVTTRQVAEHYGVRPVKNGLAPCPFHGDRKPSLKLDTRFHRFGCGADGDAVDFVSRLFSLPVRDAAEKIAQDFGIDYDREDFGSFNQPRDGPEQKQIDPAAFERMLAQYHRLLCRWAVQYAPQSRSEEWHPRFEEALLNRDHAAYLLDELQNGTEVDRLTLMDVYRNEVKQLEQRLSKLGRNAEGHYQHDGQGAKG